MKVNTAVATFGQLLETFELLLISTSGHTGMQVGRPCGEISFYANFCTQNVRFFTFKLDESAFRPTTLL